MDGDKPEERGKQNEDSCGRKKEKRHNALEGLDGAFTIPCVNANCHVTAGNIAETHVGEQEIGGNSADD